MPTNLENSEVATGLEKSVFIPIPKGNAKNVQNDHTVAPISRASKIMQNVLQTRLQQYMNWELQIYKLDLERAEEPEIKLPTCARLWKKQECYRKNIYFCFIDYAKAFDCVDHKKLWKILKEMGIPDHLTCLLRNLYAGQEATVRTRHGTIDWFQIRKGVRQGAYCHPVYLTYIQSTSCEMQGWMKHSWNQDF